MHLVALVPVTATTVSTGGERFCFNSQLIARKFGKGQHIGGLHASQGHSMQAWRHLAWTKMTSIYTTFIRTSEIVDGSVDLALIDSQMLSRCSQACVQTSRPSIEQGCKAYHSTWRPDIVRRGWEQLFHACTSRCRLSICNTVLQLIILQALTEMTRQLRAGKGKTGLVLANGGVATYQAVVCLSRSPRRDGLPYPDCNPLPDMITDVQTPSIAVQAEGDAIVETYTVEFNRDGSPLRGYVVGRLNSNGHRFISNHADESTLKQLCSWEVEPIGRRGKVRVAEAGRNLFAFASSEQARL